MNMRFFTIVWFPLIAYWALLFAISTGNDFNSSGFYVPFFVYLATSSVFALLIQNEFKKRKKDVVSTISKLNSIVVCFSLSSLIVLINTLAGKEFSRWSSILILIPLVFNLIIYSLSGIQEEQLTQGYEIRRKNREDYLELSKDWRKYLDSLKQNCNKDDMLFREIERIENIIQYSSFFRSSDSIDLFKILKSTSDHKSIIKLLRKII
tara:strand:- start:531 stop:1154 length:624 start_codon:yes stop_codon:yes gene_type:complete